MRTRRSGATAALSFEQRIDGPARPYELSPTAEELDWYRSLGEVGQYLVGRKAGLSPQEIQHKRKWGWGERLWYQSCARVALAVRCGRTPPTAGPLIGGML